MLWEETIDIEKRVNETLGSLRNLRVSTVNSEYILQDHIKNQLVQSGISFQKEYRLGPHSRVDFLVQDGVAIEVKCGQAKPNTTKLLTQLERYASYECIKAIIVVVDRNAHIPKTINKKPCRLVSLNKQWGISL